MTARDPNERWLDAVPDDDSKPKRKPAAKRSSSKPKGVGATKPKGGRVAKGAERQHLEDRRAQVDRMELAGVSYRTMAERLEVDVHTITDDVKAVLARRRNEIAGVDLQAERDKELLRLEQRVSQLTTSAARGNTAAHAQLTRIAERKAKLLGLDAPQEIALSGEIRSTLGTGLTDVELAELLVADADD